MVSWSDSDKMWLSDSGKQQLIDVNNVWLRSSDEAWLSWLVDCDIV